MNFVAFKIELTETTIQVSIIQKDNKEEFIQLADSNDNQTIYPLTIEFNNNEIIICQKEIHDNTITGFMEQLFKEPTQYNKYTINYQNKEYQVLPETLLALIIYEFKKKIDKQGIINKVEININNENKEILHRIKSSLININIPNEFTPIDNYMIRPREDFYVDEEYIVYEILENHHKYNKFVFEIERSKQIMKTTNKQLQQKEHLLNNITDYNSFYTEEKWKKFKYQFTCKEKTELKLHHLDNTYCIFLASKYFNSIDDYKNIEMTCKQNQGNSEKFFYNPISITKETINLFPNIESLYMYTEVDELLSDEIIKRYENCVTKEQGEAVGITIAKEVIELTKDFVDGYYFSFPFNRVYMLEKIINSRT